MAYSKAYYICNQVAHDVSPLVDNYIAQETRNGKTYTNGDVISQFAWNIIAIQAIEIKNGQDIKTTKANMHCYFNNIFNKSYCDEIAERVYNLTRRYVREMED